ncbi:MAG: hypothetical protein RLZZ458_2153 [Planctomycetota bacterium]
MDETETKDAPAKVSDDRSPNDDISDDEQVAKSDRNPDDDPTLTEKVPDAHPDEVETDNPRTNEHVQNSITSTFTERTQLRKAKAHYSRGEYHQAASICMQVVIAKPTLGSAWLLYGNAQLMQQKYADALNCYRSSIAATPLSTDAHANLAWLLATCPDAAIRDGKQALDHADAAHKLALLRPGFALSAMAAAHAELGNWNDAVNYETQAIGSLSGMPQQAAQKRLALYQAKQPGQDGNTPLIEQISAF